MKISKVLKLLSDLPSFYVQRQLGIFKKLPTNLTINVSYKCNSRCKTCRITTRKVKELELTEWKKIFKNYRSKVFWLILSGGEPFLKKDFVELTLLGYKYLHPEVINIPTNGILSHLIPGAVEAILKGCPGSEVVINFSMDGVGKDHDQIRGVPGNFERLLESYRGVLALKGKYSNLTVGIHSVISVFNVHKIPKLCDYALSLRPDQYLTEVAERRVELCTTQLNITPKLADYKKAINYISKRLVQERVGGLSKFTTALRLEYYKLVKLILTRKTQVIPCFAGTVSGQISAEGEVWPCCVRADNMGNLRDNGYDFAKVWFSPQAKKIKRSIKRKECYCPLASATYTNMLFNFKTGYNITSSVLNFGKKEQTKKGERPTTRYSLSLIAQIEQLQTFLPKNLEALDVGCGEGYIDELLIARGCRVTGIDYNAQAISKVKRLPGEYILTDIYDFTPKKKFDFVIMSEVLEHLPDDEKALKLVYSWLKPGGQLLVSVPGKMPLTKRLARHAMHFRHYDQKKLVKLVRKIGFEVGQTKEWGALSRFLILTSLPEFFYNIDVKYFYWPVKILAPLVRLETHLWPFPDSLILLLNKK